MKTLEKMRRRLMSYSGRGERLLLAFKARYHHFKVLLYANRSALEIMAEMEEALRGSRPYGMTFVRAKCTQVSTNVFQIIKNLNELAPEKYKEKYRDLYERFHQIQKSIHPFIHARGLPEGGSLVISLEDVNKDMADHVGGKMAYLGEIKKGLHLNVPNGFVVTTKGYRRFIEYNDLQSEIDRRIQTSTMEHLDQCYRLSSSIQQLIIRSAVPEDLEEAILDSYRLLEREEGRKVTLAMRSSALGEDLAGVSFAGQYRSELNVSGENILQAYKEIVASKYSLPAMTYRLSRGIPDEDVAMCVGCMCMLDAVSGGVVYSRNPVNIRDDSVIINSVWGLPKSVVGGSTPSDLFVVSRGNPMVIRQKEISVKEEKLICCSDDGISSMKVSADESGLASLSEEQALKIARLAERLEAYSGIPQDIEWAIGKDGSIVLLQCRALQRIDDSKEGHEKKIVGEELESVILRGGITASPGVAAGPVFIVKKDVDALKFPDGAVLVAAQSLPYWASLLSRAAAVVTQQGGIAGHLANVAREFNVPALFGVRKAMDRLTNGEWVTVDADGLRIYAGRINFLLRGRVKAKNLMEGSPVLEALKGAAQHILPLYLINPESPHFRPQNCRTLHDITRFCHEKSVEEMFRFGKEHRFLERSSKQLVSDIPLVYWIINLDDGFKEEVDGRYVHLENIVCVPMLAFWKGMTAIPWEGPPVNSRGFMSVLLEATANPALEPSIRSPYATRNYCMISRHFCTLQLRFGFHFCTVEALVGDRASDNYIIFHFKGGAANLERRMLRARLVAQILQEYEFRAEAKEDAVFARLESYDQTFMEERLKVLGHLNMHARQLDMAMSNSSSIDQHRARIMKDLKEIVLKR